MKLGHSDYAMAQSRDHATSVLIREINPNASRENRATGGARMQLRVSTREAHARLDNHRYALALMQRDTDTRHIEGALLAFYLAHQHLASRWPRSTLVAACPAVAPALSAQHHLEADCSLLNVRSNTMTANSAIRPSSDVVDYATALGVCYVILGSTMGATKIASVLAEHSDTRVRQIAYFRELSNSRGDFHEFCHLLDHSLTTPDALGRATVAANQTFACFFESMNNAEQLMATGG